MFLGKSKRRFGRWDPAGLAWSRRLGGKGSWGFPGTGFPRSGGDSAENACPADGQQCWGGGGGKAFLTRAEAWRHPRAGRASEAASGRGLGIAGCVWFWATTGVSFSSLPTAPKTTEPAAELGGGVKIESQLHTTICPGWM